MFTWICPQCGREVPPSYSECPTCAERRQQAGQPQPPQQAPPPPQPQYAPPQPQYAPPPQQPHYAPQQPAYAPPPPPQQQYAPPPQPQYTPPPQQQYAPPPQPQPQPVYTIDEQKKGLPTWLVGLLTIAVLGGALFGLYKYVGKGGNGSATTTSPAKSEADTKAAAGHPYRKYVEIVGLRILENSARKPVVRYTVVNHSPAEMQGLELILTLTATNASEPLSVIKAKVGTVDAFGVKDMEAPLETKLKVYELPDWQFVKTSFEITAPR